MPNDPLILRGRILTFQAEPSGPQDSAAYTYIEDGALLISNGLIDAVGEYAEIAQSARDATLIDHRPHLLMAGFIDAHIHFPQVQIIGSWGEQLLDWLNNYTFPAELQWASLAN